MQRDKVQLPPLQEPLNSSRIANFQDYAQWDRQRKEAYRNELREEIQEHDRSRASLQRQKERDRVEINAIVREERHRNDEDRHFKIKTEQKYMQDNWTLLQHTHRHSPRRLPNPEETPCGEHPFVRLVDGQEQRQQ
jgi:hypothetical protein